MQQIYRLEDQAWSANSNKLFRLDTLPPGKRVRSILIFVDLAGTRTEAEELEGEFFPLSIASVRLGNFCNVPGEALWELNKDIFGRNVNAAADVTGAGATFTARFALVVPFRDPRQPGSDDGSIPTELLQGRSLEVVFGPAVISGTFTTTSGTVRTMCDVVSETHVPQVAQIGFIDPGSQSVALEPGIYKSLFVMDGSGNGDISDTEIASVDLTVDGNNVHNGTRHDQVIAMYNTAAVRDSAAALPYTGAARFPLIWTDAVGASNLSKQPAVEKQGKLQITGSLAAPRIVYWRVVEKTEESLNSIAAATGAPSDSTDYEPQTASKSPLRALQISAQQGAWTKKARLLFRALPGKFRTAAEQPNTN